MFGGRRVVVSQSFQRRSNYSVQSMYVYLRFKRTITNYNPSQLSNSVGDPVICIPGCVPGPDGHLALSNYRLLPVCDFLSLAGVSVRRMSKLVRPASHVMTSALDT